MAKRLIKKNSVDQTIDIFVQDSSSPVGAGLTGLVFNSAGLTCYYRRGATGTPTQLTLATLATIGTAHADGGFKEADATNMPGVYRLDLSDAIVATGVPYVTLMLQGATDMAPVTVELQLVDFDPEDAANLGLTALTGHTPQTGDSFALLGDPRGEPAQGAPPVNPDLATKIDYLYAVFRNPSVTDKTAGEHRVYADDGTTVIFKAAFTDDGDDFVRAEFVTGA